MKKLMIGLALSALSTTALASKARLEALGETAFGSQFIDDSRNVMLNPAHLNTYKDFVTMDWGNTANTVDADSTPREEGGVFKTYKNMVVGVHFGSESDISNTLRALSGVTTEQNNTDFFVAGDAGVKWGARLTYHSYKDQSTDESSDVIRATAGIISGKTEAYLNFGVKGEAEKGDNEFQGKGSIDLGVTHRIGNMSLLGRFQSIAAEGTNQATTEEEDFKAQNFHFGAAKNYKLNEKTQAWASVWYKRDSYTNDIAKGLPAVNFDGERGDYKVNYVPVTFALETTINSWLTFRSSVTHEVYGITEDDNGDEKTNPDTTNVAAGLTLTYGDLEFDGMIGSGDADDASQSNDRNVSRVSMTYKF